MTKKIIMSILGVLVLSAALSFSLALPQANAAGWWDKAYDGGLKDVGQAYGASTPRDIRMTIVDIIKIVLGFLGIIATVIILFAGFKWMTAGGNEENVTSAKKMLIAGIIGLAIILSAYALATFVISYLVGATTGTPVIWQ